MGRRETNSRETKAPRLHGELLIVRVPLPPERKLAWRAAMSDVYALFEAACAKELAESNQQEAL